MYNAGCFAMHRIVLFQTIFEPAHERQAVVCLLPDCAFNRYSLRHAVCDMRSERVEFTFTRSNSVRKLFEVVKGRMKGVGFDLR